MDVVWMTIVIGALKIYILWHVIIKLTQTLMQFPPTYCRHGFIHIGINVKPYYIARYYHRHHLYRLAEDIERSVTTGYESYYNY